ncbi:ABC transporter permease subunit [Streptomyces mirabilis]|uniref:ABC transporter permease n=1 Tax=Streptomyces mirabilis TaxID=68239 RepID=UPI00331CCE93
MPSGASQPATVGDPRCRRERRRSRVRASAARNRRLLLAIVFVLPALVLLGALVVYPIGYTVVRSLFDASGHHFVGFGNYSDAVHDRTTLTALRNNAIWVAVAPALVTCVGLALAVLAEKIRWSTAFKLLIFMPMAISFLAAGIIFRLVFDANPQQGVINAAAVSLHDTFASNVTYPGVHPRPGGALRTVAGGADEIPVATGGTGGPVLVPLVGLSPGDIPDDARPADHAVAHPSAPGLNGVVYLDFLPGGKGRQGRVDAGEKGLPGMSVHLLSHGRSVATATTEADGSFHFEGAVTREGGLTLRLPASNFAPPYDGADWLGPMLITPVIISAYLWIWAGFAMVLIGAGLANLPRETLEAARMDGASEWQTFRRVTVPMLAPVLAVVFVTMAINVLKVFDLVFIIAPGPVQQNATVLALQMWLVSFGGGDNQGLGSALGVLLLLLVLPAMFLNVRRFKRGS